MVIFCPENVSNFTRSDLDLKTFPREKSPDPCLKWRGREWRGWEKIKGFLPLKEGEGGNDRGCVKGVGGDKKGRGGASGRGILLQGLREDRRP